MNGGSYFLIPRNQVSCTLDVTGATWDGTRYIYTALSSPTFRVQVSPELTNISKKYSLYEMFNSYPNVENKEAPAAVSIGNDGLWTVFPKCQDSRNDEVGNGFERWARIWVDTRPLTINLSPPPGVYSPASPPYYLKFETRKSPTNVYYTIGTSSAPEPQKGASNTYKMEIVDLENHWPHLHPQETGIYYKIISENIPYTQIGKFSVRYFAEDLVGHRYPASGSIEAVYEIK